MWAFFTLYFYVQRFPQFPVTRIPLTWLDRAVPMQSWGWIPYLSLWVYTSLPPALQPNFRSLTYYGLCIGAVCGTGLLCFYFWPTAVSVDLLPLQSPPAWIYGIDLARNACPSLHVATALFSSLWLHWQLRQVGAGPAWRVLNVLWGVIIVYSTLVTKQHVVWDVVAGLALGGASAYASIFAMRLTPIATFFDPMRHAPEALQHRREPA